MSELSVLELEAQHSELLPEREALGVVAGPVGHSRFGSHNSNSHNRFDSRDSHNSFGRDSHSSFGHSNNRR